MTHESRFAHQLTDSQRRAALPTSIIARKTSGSEPAGAYALRQRLGNQGIQRLMSEIIGQSKSSTQGRSSGIQAKLAISQPGDIHEQEADRVANAVMRMPDSSLQESPAVRSGAIPAVQRMCAECDDELEKKTVAPVQRKEQTADVPPATPSVAANIQSLRGSGRALPAATRAFFEPRFGADFSSVRVHTDERANATAKSIGAKAFTHGHDIAFASGEYSPSSSEGRHLLAHELTHVVQQSRSAGDVPELQRDGPKPGSPAAKLETAKNNLKAKYGLKDISEQGGVAWTEGQLKRIDATFSKMSPEEQKRLQGVTLVLVDKLPSKKLKGKTFNIAGTTYGTHRVELTSVGVRQTVMHEAGHLIHHTAIADAEKLFDRSQVKADLDTARNFLEASSKQRFHLSDDEKPNFDQFKTVITAGEAFERSDDADRVATRATLEEAELSLLPFISSPDARALSAHADKIRAWVAALLRWSDEREKVVGSVKRLDEFVSIVKTHRLARRSFPAFSSYAESNWPDKPAEFFAEAYDYWRKNPADMKRKGRALFDWFEKGGHLGPKLPSPGSP